MVSHYLTWKTRRCKFSTGGPDCNVYRRRCYLASGVFSAESQGEPELEGTPTPRTPLAPPASQITPTHLSDTSTLKNHFLPTRTSLRDRFLNEISGHVRHFSIFFFKSLTRKVMRRLYARIFRLENIAVCRTRGGWVLMLHKFLSRLDEGTR